MSDEAPAEPSTSTTPEPSSEPTTATTPNPATSSAPAPPVEEDVPFDSGLNYPEPPSPFDPSNPLPSGEVPPDSKQPGGIKGPLTVEEAIAAPPKSEAEKAAEVPPAQEQSTPAV